MEKLQGDRVISRTTNVYENGALCESYRESNALASVKLVDEMKFNENGHVVYMKTSYNDEVKSIVEYEYTYNENGDVQTISGTVTVPTPNGDQTSSSTQEYIYDENGFLKEITGTVKTEVKCDENGNVIEQCIYDGNGNISQKSVYTYY